MNLQETVKTNMKILALIESKYSGPFALWPTSPESRYYSILFKATQKVEEALKHEGLVPIVDKESKDDLSF
jgi:hypothetical protein